jgi:hypothetical protein
MALKISGSSGQTINRDAERAAQTKHRPFRRSLQSARAGYPNQLQATSGGVAGFKVLLPGRIAQKHRIRIRTGSQTLKKFETVKDGGAPS